MVAHTQGDFMPTTITPVIPLTPEVLPQLAERLQTLRAELLAQVHLQRGGEISRSEAAANVRSVEPGDWAHTDAEQDLSVALEERELAELNNIERAQKALADGSYGECVACGADIGLTRLQAVPTAMRCIACQTQLEQQR
jgi:DnaK suppressor protein